MQCKTGRLRRGAIKFSTRSVRVNTRGAYTRGYEGEVEYFAVYCTETHGVYLMPIEEATVAAGSLRVDPPLNNQAKRIRWAADYELAAAGPMPRTDLDSLHTPA